MNDCEFLISYLFRSGLAVKNGIDVGAGVVDYDYRGNVGVVLFNHLEEDLNVKKGDRIAQLVLEKIFMPELVPVRVSVTSCKINNCILEI